LATSLFPSAIAPLICASPFSEACFSYVVESAVCDWLVDAAFLAAAFFFLNSSSYKEGKERHEPTADMRTKIAS